MFHEVWQKGITDATIVVHSKSIHHIDVTTSFLQVPLNLLFLSLFKSRYLGIGNMSTDDICVLVSGIKIYIPLFVIKWTIPATPDNTMLHPLHGNCQNWASHTNIQCIYQQIAIWHVTRDHLVAILLACQKGDFYACLSFVGAGVRISYTGVKVKSS